MIGFSDEARKGFDVSQMGAIVTNPLSFSARVPSRPPRLVEFPGGFLLHTGHPNPGFSKTLRDHASRWITLSPPIIVNILSQSVEDTGYMLERLEVFEVVSAVELGLGDIDANSAAEIVSASRYSELPIIANAPLNVDKSVFISAASSGASAISLGPARGTIRQKDGSMINGRIFGPSVLPFALRALSSIVDQVDIPVIASGGIYHIADVKAMLEAGASAVQLDSVLWTDPREILSYFHDNLKTTPKVCGSASM
jgi:dihydroorotate dehydrogenase (NAD+) catalytic subunit